MVSVSAHVFVIFLYVTSCCCQDDLRKYGDLVLVILNFRHGARAPEFQCSGDLRVDVKKDFPAGIGELSQRGKNESFALGQYLRKRYAGFLPEEYHADEVYVRSSAFNRNLVSSYLVMASLFPPLNKESRQEVFWQQVPVQTAPVECDLLLQGQPFCPAVTIEHDDVKMTDEFRCMQRKSQIITRLVENHTGSSDILSAADCILSKRYQGLMIPEWIKEMYYEQLTSYRDLYNFLVCCGTTKIQRLYIGPFFQELQSILKRKIQGTLIPDRKLFAYSSHDTNILATLCVLGGCDSFTPAYSSCLFFELWRLAESSEKYAITVSYRNGTSDPQILRLPGCSSVACTFEEFSKVIRKVLHFRKEECFNTSTQQAAEPVNLVQPTNIAEYWKECFNKTELTQGEEAFIDGID